MLNKIILASKSKVRKQILDKHNLSCEVKPSNIDEDVVKESFINEKIPNSKSKDKYLGIDPISEMSKNKKNYNILGFTIVFIISFIALIIVLDTFQSPISKIVPDIEFLLYSLYETINDIKLFLKDLI